MSAMDILSEGSDKPEIQQMLYSLVTVSYTHLVFILVRRETKVYVSITS